MEHLEWFKMGLRKWKDFDSRSRRKEYWMYLLFIVIISIVLSVIDSIIGYPILGGSSHWRR